MIRDIREYDFPVSHRKHVLVVLGICAVALCVRLSFLSSWAGTPLFHSLLGDELNFHNTALSLLGKRSSEGPFLYQPLYSFFLATVYWLFGPGTSLVRIIQLLSGVAGVYLAYLLGKKMGGMMVGYISALLMALYGPLVFFEGHLLASGLVVFLLTGAFVFLLHSRQQRHSWLVFFSGLFMSMAMMGRPNLGVILPVAFVWLLRGKLPWKIRALQILLAFVGLMLGLSPSILYNASHGAGFVPVSTAGGISFFIGNNPKATGRYHIPKAQGIDPSSHQSYSRSLTRVAEQDEGRKLTQSEVSDYWYARGFDFWRQQPLDAMGLFGKKLLMAFGAQEQPIHNPYELGCELAPVLRLLLTFGVILPFFVLGVFWTARSMDGGWMLATCVVVYALSMAVFYVSDRYRLVMVPMMAPLSAAGMVELARRFKGGGLKAVWSGLVIIGLSFGASEISRVWSDEARILSAGYNRLGTSAGNLGRLDEAGRAFSRAISLAGPRAGVGLRMNLAMTYFKKGDFRQAAKWFEDAARRSPGNPRPLAMRAKAAENMGELEDAILWWSRAARFMTGDAFVRDHIKRLRRRMGTGHAEDSVDGGRDPYSK